MSDNGMVSRSTHTYDLAVAAIGDPQSPTTWSGTSARVVAGLEQLGIRVLPIDVSRLPFRSRAVAFTRHQIGRQVARRVLFGRGTLSEEVRQLRTSARSDYNWTLSVREARSRRVISAARTAGVNVVLHMYNNALPTPPDTKSSIHHLLLTDSTWHGMRAGMPSSRLTEQQMNRFDQIERRMMNQVDHIFAIGEYVRDAVIEHYCQPISKVTAVGSGFTMPRYDGPKDYSSAPVLFVAKARWEEKGGDLLLRAFEIARRRLPSLRLMIVGQDRHIAKYASVAGVFGYGYLPFERLSELFSRARLFAMPAFGEPWGLVYLEALACRTPILGLNRMGFPEISGYGRYGFAVDEPTPESVADALLSAVGNPSRLERMGFDGQNAVFARYSWDRVVGRIADVIRSYVQARPV